MKTLSFLLSLCGLVVAAFLVASPAHAQATRTWVSGVGDDANPCSRTAPCKTFAGAISKTADGGEINTIDPGGFGGVTITKSITISGDHVQAGIVVSGTNAIIVNAPGKVVTLRNLNIAGLGTGLSGVRFIQGAALHVENSTIRDFRGGTSPSGIEFAPSQPGVLSELFVHNVAVSGSGTGSIGGAILIRPTAGGMASAFIDRARLEDNARGIVVDGTGGTGAMNVVVSNSLTVGAPGPGVLATTASTVIRMTVDAVMSARNLQGVSVIGAGATVIVGNSSIVNNGTGVVVTGGGTLQSFKNNHIANNTTNGTPITVVPGGPLN